MISNSIKIPRQPAATLRRASDLVLAHASRSTDEQLDVHAFIRLAMFRRNEVLDTEAYWEVRRVLRAHLDAEGVSMSTPRWNDSVSPQEMAEMLRAAADSHDGTPAVRTADSPSAFRDPFAVPAAAA